MQKIFSIIDGDGTNFGHVTYDTETRAWQVSFNPLVPSERQPLTVSAYTDSGHVDLDEKMSLEWIRDRLLPPSRQNITAALSALGLETYDEYALICHSGGVSSQDFLKLTPEVSASVV